MGSITPRAPGPPGMSHWYPQMGLGVSPQIARTHYPCFRPVTKLPELHTLRIQDCYGTGTGHRGPDRSNEPTAR